MELLAQHKTLRRRVQQQLEEHEQWMKHHGQTSFFRRAFPNENESEGGHKIRSDKEEKHADDVVVHHYAMLDGITIQRKENGQYFYQVGWESPSDSINPRNWSKLERLKATLLFSAAASIVTAASAINSTVLPQAARELGVSEEIEALSSTGVFLFGLGLGPLLASPTSEIWGRYLVYLAAFGISGSWIVGAALTPNIGSQILFRFLAGFFAAAPLTVAGGSLSDIWSSQEMIWAFPIFSTIGFSGPVAAQVIGSYVGQSEAIDWRWTEWLILIAYGLIIAIMLLMMRETFEPRLLGAKAKQFRYLTGDDLFLSAIEAQGTELKDMLKKDFSRPFILALEPIVYFLTLYLTVVFVVLYTFLVGYADIFQEVYHIDQGLKNICFIGLLVGILGAAVFTPFVKAEADKQFRRDERSGSGSEICPESRVIFAMIGAPMLPIGLFWMGWTDYPSISIWSPLAASVPIGFAAVSIFNSSYMYVIDSYQMHAASALTFATLTRYIGAGAMTVVGFPMYKNLGVQLTLTVLGSISVIIAPIPYVLFFYGRKIRAKSKYAVHP